MSFALVYDRFRTLVQAYATARGHGFAHGIQTAAQAETLRQDYEALFSAHAFSLLVALPGGVTLDEGPGMAALRLSLSLWLVENPALARDGVAPGTVLAEADLLAVALLGAEVRPDSLTKGRQVFTAGERFLAFDGAPGGILFHQFSFTAPALFTGTVA